MKTSLSWGVIRDITEKKQAEKQLELLQFAIDRSHDAVFLIDYQGRFQYVNQSACRKLGYSREELLTLAVNDIDPEHPLEAWNDHWREVQWRGQMHCESTHQRRDGSCFPVEIDLGFFCYKEQGYLFALAQDVSERKLAAKALAQQSDLLAAVFHDIPDGLALTDAERRIVRVNPGFTQIFGYSEAEVIGRLSRDFYADQDDFMTQGERRYHRSAADELIPYTVTYRRKNGEVFPGDTTGVPVRDRDGELLGYLGVIRDISGRLMAEQKLKDSEAHFRAIFEQAQDAIVLVEPETQRFIEFNEPAHRNLGYSREEFSKLRISDIEAEQDEHAFKRLINKLFSSGQEIFETRHLTKQGEIRNQLVSINLIKLGARDRFISIWRDITELKQAHEDIERFFHLSVDLFTIASLDGRFLRVSPAWSEVLGWSEAEFLSRPVIEFVHPDDRAMTQQHRASLIEGQRLANFENRYQTKGGEYRWLSWNALRQPDGRRLYAVARDITEQKRLEQELLHAQKMEAIGQLTAGIAHDFNNLLATVLGFAQLSRDRLEQLPKEKLQTYLSNIVDAGNRGRDLVAQMLTFSTSRPSEKEPIVDLAPLVNEVCRMFSSVLPSSITLEMNVDEKLPGVAIDPVKFHQVLMNLCVNARDAMAGKGRLEIALRKVDFEVGADTATTRLSAGNWIMLMVSDTGAGMDLDTQSRIFDPFFTTKEIGKGSGMGLSVVHGIMKSIRGQVRVESELGKGCRFQLLFPIAEAVTPEQSSGIPSPALPDPTSRGRHLLVVDDEPGLVAYLREFLGCQGYQVTSLTDSQQALAMIETQQAEFDLLISDQTMPNLTGLELAIRLR